MTLRGPIAALWRAALEAAQGDRLLGLHASVTGDHWNYAASHFTGSVRLPGPNGRVLVVGAGKAAGALASGLEKSLGARIDDGVVIVKSGHTVPLRHIQTFEAAHPVPDAAGHKATQQILKLLAGVTHRDLVFVLLTGGASALLVAPADGITLAEKSQVHAALVRSGASIQEMNVVRKHLSAVKGGKLAAHMQGAAVVTLLISDVIGDDPATIASGPTVADPSTFQDAIVVLQRHRLLADMPPRSLAYLQRGAAGIEADTPKFLPASLQSPWILASNRQSRAAAEAAGRSLGYDTQVLAEELHGDTHDAARQFARQLHERIARRSSSAPLMFLAGGETTLRVRGTGRGGRCQEFALVAAQSLAEVPRYALLAAGTDGSDGPTDAAGAFVDQTTLSRAAALRLEPAAFLADNNSHEFFRQLGDLFITGPTGTNVMDLVIAIVP